MNCSLPTRNWLKTFLAAAYLMLSAYLLISYFFLSDTPIIAPLKAKLHSFRGDIKELPLGENWTRQYTLRVSSLNGAGLINTNCVIFSPFPASKRLEVEICSLLICPGYQTKMTILFNNHIVADQVIGYNWQVISFSAHPYHALLLNNIRLRFEMIKISDIPEYKEETLLQFFPNEEGIRVWNSQLWQRRDEVISSDKVRVERSKNLLKVNGQQFAIERWPLTLVLASMSSLMKRNQLQNIPMAACRAIRII